MSPVTPIPDGATLSQSVTQPGYYHTSGSAGPTSTPMSPVTPIPDGLALSRNVTQPGYHHTSGAAGPTSTSLPPFTPIPDGGAVANHSATNSSGLYPDLTE